MSSFLREWMLSLLFPECTHPWCKAPSRVFESGEEVVELTRGGQTVGMMHVSCAAQHRQQQLCRLNREFN